MMAADAEVASGEGEDRQRVDISDKSPAAPTYTTQAVLAQLRCLTLRARLVACELDMIGVSLRSGMIDCETAIAWAQETGALAYCDLTAPERGA